MSVRYSYRMTTTRKFNTTAGWGRCGHRYCGDCATRRGNRRGNRRARAATRRAIRQGREV